MEALVSRPKVRTPEHESCHDGEDQMSHDFSEQNSLWRRTNSDISCALD